MAYFGVLLAALYLWKGFEVVLQPRPRDVQLYDFPINPAIMGFILGVAIILATVGPFVLLGASCPATPVLLSIVIVSIIETVAYYWRPAVVSLRDCR